MWILDLFKSKRSNFLNPETITYNKIKNILMQNNLKKFLNTYDYIHIKSDNNDNILYVIKKQDNWTYRVYSKGTWQFFTHTYNALEKDLEMLIK